MEYLDGVRLVDGVRNQFRAVATHFGTTLEALEAERAQQMSSGDFKFKSIKEAVREEQSIKTQAWLYDTLFSANILRSIYNGCVLPVLSLVGLPVTQLPFYCTPVPIDLANILQMLCNVHAFEIFEGVFNGDPHPGNILLLKDGKLGLIDYGQMKSMTTEQRIVFAKMIIAISRDDKPEIVRIFFDEMRAVTKHRDADTAYKFCCFWNDRDTDDIMSGMNIANFLDHLEATDPMLQLPEDFLLASRVSILMRGMGNAFGIKLRMSQLWEEQARLFLKKQGVSY